MDDWIKVTPADVDDWQPVAKRAAAPRGGRPYAEANPSQALPANPPLPQGVGARAPFAQLAPEPMNQALMEFSAKDVKYLIDEGLVRGIDNVVGAPVDLATFALNLLSRGGTAALNAVLPDDQEIEAPQIENPVLGSKWMHDLYLEGERQAGRPVYTDEDVGLTTRVGASALDFGAQGVTGGAALSAAAAKRAAQKGAQNLGPVLQQYAKRPIATTAVDTAAGAGAGVADQTAKEYGIENPLVRLILASSGGWAGARAAQTAVAPAAGVRALLDRVLLDPKIAPDTIAGVATGTSRRVADAAARRVQGAALDPAQAESNIRQTTTEAREMGWTPPTAGLASDDPGLMRLEAQARLQSPTMSDRGPMAGAPVFVERDRAVQQDLSRALSDLGPQDGKPRVPTDLATQQAAAKAAELDAARTRALLAREGAQADTATAQSRLAAEREARMAAARQDVATAEAAFERARQRERELGSAVQGNLGGKGPASENLATAVAGAKAIDEGTKRGLYQQAQAMSEGVALPVGDLGADVAAIKAELAPLVGHDRAVSNAIPDLDLLAEEGVTALPLNKVIAMLPRLSAAGDAAVRNMRGDVAQAVASIETDLKSRIRALAEQGDEAAIRWAEAEQNFRDNFAPKYREGVGARLDKAERRGQPVPPTAQAGLFLKPRGGGKEAAEDLNRILRGAPTEAAGRAAARDYVLADLATLVADNGTIRPNRLRAWAANHAEMLSQLPAVREEVQKLLLDVVNARAGANKTKMELDQIVAKRLGLKESLARREKQVMADARLNEKQKAAALAKIDQDRGAYERDLQSNAVRHLINADPDHAVSAVLGSRDPERAMAQVMEHLKSDSEAVAGWKRAVADHLYSQAKNLSAPNTPQGLDPLSLTKVSQILEQNRPALAKVFGPREMHTLTRVQRVLDVAARKGMVTGAGVPAGQPSLSMGLVEIFLKTIYGGLKGGNKLRNLKVAMQIAPGAPLDARVDRLVERAMLDPELMLHLLNVPVTESLVPQWNRNLTRLLAVRNTLAAPEE